MKNALIAGMLKRKERRRHSGGEGYYVMDRSKLKISKGRVGWRLNAHNITGHVQCQYSYYPKDTKYPIMQTLNGTINGTFAPKAIATTGDIKTLNIDYRTPNVVYLVYPLEKRKRTPALFPSLPVFRFHD